MTNIQIQELKLQIDSIKEYITSDICKTCYEMEIRLNEYEKLLKEYAEITADK